MLLDWEDCLDSSFWLAPVSAKITGGVLVQNCVSLYLCTASDDRNGYLRLRTVLYKADAETYLG